MNKLYDVIPETMGIGDRVRVIRDSDGESEYNGLLGTIVCPFDGPEYDWGVDLDSCHIHSMSDLAFGHDLDGFLEQETGRWFKKRHLEFA